MITYAFSDQISADCPRQEQATENGIAQIMGAKITRAEQINGLTRFRKWWIISDTDVTVYQYLYTDYPMLEYSIFACATDDDCPADIVGDEKRYSSYSVKSNTTSTVTIKNNSEILIEAGDKVAYANGFWDVDTITDNGDNTFTIDFSQDVTDEDMYGKQVANCFATDLVANEWKPFWLKMEWISGTTQNEADYDTIELKAQ